MDHEKDCPLCAVTRKVFGEKYPSCAAISNELIIDVLDMMKARVNRLTEEADVKLKRGEITSEEHRLACDNANFSQAFAVASLTAAMTIDGPRLSPPQMMQLIDEKMRQVITTLLLEKLGLSVQPVQPPEAQAESVRKAKATDPSLN